jgi:multiple sugar transport system ATP-binding protein
LARVLLEDLTKAFGKLVAVNNVSLEVRDKEFVTLLGPSGCGKTTTLRMIAGLERPDSGNIYIDDTLVNELPPADRDIAMTFQFYAIYPSMTVHQNLAFPLESRGMPKDEIKRSVKEAAEALRIDHLLGEVATRLNAGEQQRVALGRAIVRRPKVTLLDEPLTNLDAALRATMRTELKRIQKELGQTTICVTHDQLEAMTMADRIAIMDVGVLQQYDAPSNIYDHPRNLFVADFIGTPSMNFIDCSFAETKERVLLESSDFSFPVSEFGGLIKDRATSSELVLGIRPSDISLHKEKPSEDAIQAKVDITEPLGDKLIIDLSIGENLVKALTSVSSRVEIGEKLWILFDRQRMHVFDKKTRETIV